MVSILCFHYWALSSTRALLIWYFVLHGDLISLLWSYFLVFSFNINWDSLNMELWTERWLDSISLISSLSFDITNEISNWNLEVNADLIKLLWFYHWTLASTKALLTWYFVLNGDLIEILWFHLWALASTKLGGSLNLELWTEWWLDTNCLITTLSFSITNELVRSLVSSLTPNNLIFFTIYFSFVYLSFDKIRTLPDWQK